MMERRDLCREAFFRLMTSLEQAWSKTFMAKTRFFLASSSVLDMRTDLMIVRILFFKAELRAVLLFVRRISFIEDLIIGMNPPKIVTECETGAYGKQSAGNCQ